MGNNTTINSQGSEDLKNQVVSLRREIEDLHNGNQALWFLLVNISKKIQASSTAIKASVSSLLGYDIIWDASTQHEILEVIDTSTDQVSKYVMLLTLVSKMESNSPVLNPEPNEIHEILSSVTENVSGNYPELSIDINTHTSNSPVCVDYEYLSIALVMLFELMIETQTLPQQLNIFTEELKDHLFVDIKGVDQDVDKMLKVSESDIDELIQDAYLLPTTKLKLYVVYKVLELQSIQIKIKPKIEKPTSICLMIPIVK
ncbi:MAG: HAMP domain-containing histidine kinase [Gammaproteobacteria bacterium]|jgi:K+-sensing histidine kinase KdpD|nr:HAMP domain-containing histidine kinase [Gammaproteobacteria bacterium]MBT5996162.1 HAMP domain-containing histidine kinase [Candidatus Neomarinimicrobiota bacterium]